MKDRKQAGKNAKAGARRLESVIAAVRERTSHARSTLAYIKYRISG